jgi:glycosyltransferase involved in cell wall biosynthesis
VFARIIAFVVLGISFTISLCVAIALRRCVRRSRVKRVMVTGTFYNAGWFRSHIVPLSQSGASEIVVVADSELSAPPGVRFICPAPWFAAIAGRAVSKTAAMWWHGLRVRPDLFMGYHLFPGGLATLCVARLLRRPACYQMTGGPIEVIGGGARSENVLTSRLGRDSPFLERLALKVLQEFELVVVRGQQAREYLEARGVSCNRVVTIPGSVPDACFRSTESRKYELLFVGRLADIKRPLLFVDIVADVCRRGHAITAVMVGGGPLEDDVRRRIREHGIEDSIKVAGKQEDVTRYLADARIFVLTSRSEGLSIAMAEAMAAGCVPVVADVGELRDVVEDKVSGFLIDSDDPAAYARAIEHMISRPDEWQRLSRCATVAAQSCCSVAAVTRKWASAISAIAPSVPQDA